MKPNNDKPREMERTRTFSEVSTIKLTPIVQTPMRLVDLLEHDSGLFTLRETSYKGAQGGGAEMDHIHLYRHELEKLGIAITRLLADGGKAA